MRKFILFLCLFSFCNSFASANEHNYNNLSLYLGIDFNNCLATSLEPPEVPVRPSFVKLGESLTDSAAMDKSNKEVKTRVRVKNLPDVDHKISPSNISFKERFRLKKNYFDENLEE